MRCLVYTSESRAFVWTLLLAPAHAKVAREVAFCLEVGCSSSRTIGRSRSVRARAHSVRQGPFREPCPHLTQLAERCIGMTSARGKQTSYATTFLFLLHRLAPSEGKSEPPQAGEHRTPQPCF